MLAKQDVHRRAELFSLSQPGGHPHNWNNVSSECFNTLRLLAERVTEFNEKASVASGQARQLSGDKTPLAKQAGIIIIQLNLVICTSHCKTYNCIFMSCKICYSL